MVMGQRVGGLGVDDMLIYLFDYLFLYLLLHLFKSKIMVAMVVD